MDNQIITSLSGSRVIYPSTTSLLNTNSNAIYERESTTTLLQHLKSNKHILLHGIPQSGKTTLLLKLAKVLSLEAGNEAIFYCDVQGMRIQHGEQLEKVLEGVRGEGRKYVFLDHVEGLAGWEGVV
eukprot:TRINITY_DN11298_c0_g1_i1.p1 TRINITY_DN11298_c0_g1~~TRINITY_DN11298_c0_g1_i1.p1  ORF type:complete len:126 (+),score=36.59 TRINITY_DN11298_c0_g1_i1:123-500(+)